MTKKRLILNIILLVLYIAGVVVLDYFNSKQAATSTNLEGEVSTKKQQGEHLQKLNSDWQNITPNVAAISALLPNEDSFSTVATYFEKAAEKTGVSLNPDYGNVNKHLATPSTATSVPSENTTSTDGSTPQNTSKSVSPQIPSITFVIEATGSLDAVKSFYQELDRCPFFLAVDSAIITATTGTTANTAPVTNIGPDTNFLLSANLTLYVDASLKQ